MTKQKVGLLVFWAAVIWAIVWGVAVSAVINPIFNDSTLDELNQTMWAIRGPWFAIWGLGGAPLAALVAGIGLLVYCGAKSSTTWRFGIGIFLAVIAALAVVGLGHFPWLFGIGGTLILLLFFGLLWLWAKERRELKGSGARAADLKLVGYVFLLIAAWFVCGFTSQFFSKAFEGVAPASPTHILIFLVLGWLFLFLGHYQASGSRSD